MELKSDAMAIMELKSDAAAINENPGARPGLSSQREQVPLRSGS